MTFKVEKWNPHAGAKASLEIAWFRILGIPMEKRSVQRTSCVSFLVGLPLEVDKPNLMRGEYVRVLIGCRDITKIPASVEGVIDQHFYDFIFQREVPQEGITNSSGTKWVRTDHPSGDNPSPKKHKIGDRVNNEDEVKESQDQGDTSGSDHDRKHISHKTVVTEDTHSLEGLDSAGR